MYATLLFVFFFISRPGEAHQISNTSTEEFVYLVIADNPTLDCCYYPDSKKVLFDAVSDRRILKGEEAGYFEGGRVDIARCTPIALADSINCRWACFPAELQPTPLADVVGPAPAQLAVDAEVRLVGYGLLGQ